MSKLAYCLVLSFTLLIFLSASTAAQVSHNVWSDKPISVIDGNTHAKFSTFVEGNASFAWTQGTTRAYAHAVGEVTAALTYDFMLVSITSTTVDEISGRWRVRRNGVVVCNNCIGKAYLLSSAGGGTHYFKIYVGTPFAYQEKWHYSGYVTNRFDY